MFSPPTDNLYKFLAIFGLIIVIFSIYYPFQKLHELEFLAVEAKAAMDLGKFKAERLVEKFNLQKEQINVGGNFKEKMADADNLEKEILEQYKTQVNIESNGIKIKILMAKYAYYKVAGIMGIVLGLLLMGVGFTFWYTKIQKSLDYQAAKALAQAKEKDLIIPP